MRWKTPMKKRRIIHRAAVFAMTASFLILPACRKKQRVAQVPPAPQPPATAPTAPPATAPTAPPATVPTIPKKPLAVSLGYSEDGVASWYGVPFNGRAAADGEIYDMETLVAAHRLLPFNTWLKVTNLRNNKSVNVRVIDRGPFVEGRILDLSKAAAREIDLLGPGTGAVHLEVIASPVDIPSNDFYAVQVGAFAVRANAERVRGVYAQRFGNAQLVLRQGPTPLWRVLVGKEPSIQAAQQLRTQLSAEDKNVFVVRLDQTLPNGPGATAGAPAATQPQTPPID